jgi:hypothetical protein
MSLKTGTDRTKKQETHLKYKDINNLKVWESTLDKVDFEEENFKRNSETESHYSMIKLS